MKNEILGAVFGSGAGLILEHLIHYGYVDFTDIVGHDFYGAVMMIGSAIAALTLR